MYLNFRLVQLATWLRATLAESAGIENLCAPH